MIVQIGPLSIHLESLVLGVMLGVSVPLLIDRYVFRPLARWLVWAEHRWHGRLRAR